MVRDRESGAELLRIAAMFLVVLVHVDFWSLGYPSKEEIQSVPAIAFSRHLIESIGIICVNCFVFVSGWFGIRPTLKRFIGIIFQVLFYYSLVFFSFIWLGFDKFSWALAIRHFNFFHSWFVITYLALFLLAPILNKFVESSDEKSVRNIVIVFLLLDIIFGWGKDYLHFGGGYTLLHFFVIYIIARYINNFKNIINIHFKLSTLSSVFVICVLLNTILAFGTFYVNETIWLHMSRLYAYNSPIVILASICFSLFFISLKFKSRVVNLVASTSFAVYLIHVNYVFSYNHMRGLINGWFQSYDFSVFCLYAFLFILSLFFCAFVLDKIRQMLWETISRYIR